MINFSTIQIKNCSHHFVQFFHRPPIKKLYTCIFFILLSGCVSSPSSVSSLTSSDNQFLVTEREIGLKQRADKIHKEMYKKGLIYRNEKANEYLSRLGNSLIPKNLPNSAKFNFYIFKSPTINAFAMPNGNIYMHIGLLAKLENEEQLAFVLAHEIAHVVERHSYKNQLNRHNTIVAAHVADLFLFGTGLAYLPAGMELAAHSRAQEEESDTQAIHYLAAKNYDLGRSINTFKKLVQVKHNKIEASIWASHPDSNLRRDNTQSIIKNEYSNYNAEPKDPIQYNDFRNQVSELNIKLLLFNRNYELAEDAVNHEINNFNNSPTLVYYLAETHRKRADDPAAAAREHAWLYDKTAGEALTQKFQQQADDERAVAENLYNDIPVSATMYPESRRGLGLTFLSKGDKTQATKLLQEYLSLKENPKDLLYINKILEETMEDKQ